MSFGPEYRAIRVGNYASRAIRGVFRVLASACRFRSSPRVGFERKTLVPRFQSGRHKCGKIIHFMFELFRPSGVGC